MASVPLHQAKADLFRTLGHPLRIRVLELLQEGPAPVRDLLVELEIEPSNLSQQLAVLRRANLVTSTREGATAVYELTTPAIGELLAVGRGILAALWGEAEDLLDQLRADESPSTRL